jgi:iron(III) transport system ATP-binding protein
VLKVDTLCTDYADAQGRLVHAVQAVSFEVGSGKLFTLLGPSGCGKTTTLRSIAGLERPQSGTIAVDGTVVYSSAQGVFVAPNKRKFGMVFQSYAIWPHMNVFQNAAFPLEVGSRRMTRQAIREKVMRVLHTVGLEELAEREATGLSGGQQQRLALARALVMEPKLLLLDEPLSNLDAKLRERMRFELKRLQNELGLTTVYVTHDQYEALALSHEIAVMNAGRIVQIGSPRDIYERPRDKFVADFVGSTNFIEGTVVALQDNTGRYRMQTALGMLIAESASRLAPGGSALLSVRPEDVALTTKGTAGDNVCSGVVRAIVFLGEFLDLQIEAGGQMLLARCHPTVNAVAGQTVYLQLSPEKCIVVTEPASQWK